MCCAKYGEKQERNAINILKGFFWHEVCFEKSITYMDWKVKLEFSQKE